jgi:hypothetical protein
MRQRENLEPSVVTAINPGFRRPRCFLYRYCSSIKVTPAVSKPRAKPKMLPCLVGERTLHMKPTAVDTTHTALLCMPNRNIDMVLDGNGFC